MSKSREDVFTHFDLMDYTFANRVLFDNLTDKPTFKNNVVEYSIYEDGTGVNMITESQTPDHAAKVRAFILKKLPEAAYTKSGH